MKLVTPKGGETGNLSVVRESLVRLRIYLRTGNRHTASHTTTSLEG